MKKQNKNYNVVPKTQTGSISSNCGTHAVDAEQVYKNRHNFDIEEMYFDLCEVCLDECNIEELYKANPILSRTLGDDADRYEFVCNKELNIAYAYPTKFNPKTENPVYTQDLVTRRTFAIKPNFNEFYEDTLGTRKLKAFIVTKVFCAKTMPDIYINYDTLYSYAPSSDDLKKCITIKKIIKLDNMYRKDSTGKFKEVQKII